MRVQYNIYSFGQLLGEKSKRKPYRLRATTNTFLVPWNILVFSTTKIRPSPLPATSTLTFKRVQVNIIQYQVVCQADLSERVIFRVSSTVFFQTSSQQSWSSSGARTASRCLKTLRFTTERNNWFEIFFSVIVQNFMSVPIAVKVFLRPPNCDIIFYRLQLRAALSS